MGRYVVLDLIARTVRSGSLFRTSIETMQDQQSLRSSGTWRVILVFAAAVLLAAWHGVDPPGEVLEALKTAGGVGIGCEQERDAVGREHP